MSVCFLGVDENVTTWPAPPNCVWLWILLLWNRKPKQTFSSLSCFWCWYFITVIKVKSTVINKDEIKARNCLTQQLHFHELQHALIYRIVYLGQDLPLWIRYVTNSLQSPCLVVSRPHVEACVRSTHVCTLLPYIILTESQFTEQVQMLNVFEQPFPP